MSPLWRDEVLIYLSPRKIALLRRSRGLIPRVVVSSEIVVSNDGNGEIEPALLRLATLLQSPDWQGADARVVIADCWARYAILPPMPGAPNAAARMEQARYAISDTYGEITADWSIVLEDGPPGRDIVVCAMPAHLKSNIGALLSEVDLRLKSLQVQLVVAFNAWRKELPGDDAWFFSLQDGWLSGLHLSGGAWDRVHLVRLSKQISVDLRRTVALGRLSGAASGSMRMFIDAPIAMRERLRPVSSSLEWLEPGIALDGMPHELDLLLRACA